MKTTTAAATRIGPSTLAIVRGLRRRIRAADDSRDARLELIEPRAELEPTGGVALLPGEQNPRPDNFDALERVGFEEPLHHLTVEQRERELLLAAYHTEAPVEVVVLELDVVQTEMTPEAREEVLVRQSQGRAAGRHGQQRARETVVG